MVSSIPSSHNLSIVPFSKEPLSKNQFIELIQEAQKTDTQVYTKEKLTPFKLNLNAALPGIGNLFFAPYQILHNSIQLLKNQLNAKKVGVTEVKFDIAAMFFNFLDAALSPIFYLGSFGIFVLQVHILLPVIFTVSLLSCLVGIAFNSFRLLKTEQFKKQYNSAGLKLLAQSLEIPSLKNFDKMKPLMVRLIKAIEQEGIPEKHLAPLRELFHSEDNFEKDIESFLSVCETLKNALAERVLHKIHDDFFELSPREKESLLKKSLDLYKKDPFSAHAKSIHVIQKRFKEKKIELARVIDPVLTEYLILNSKELFKKDNQVKAVTLIERKNIIEKIHKNTQSRKEILITNLFLFSITLAVSALGSFFHVPLAVTAILFTISLAFYLHNSAKIQGRIQSLQSSFDWENCIPQFLKTATEKIQKIFHKTQPAKVT